MKKSFDLEPEVKSIALKILEQGRGDWDVPHTLAVVYWMKKLIKKEGGDPKILVTAAYFHDIGYIDLIDWTNYDHKKNLSRYIGFPVAPVASAMSLS